MTKSMNAAVDLEGGYRRWLRWYPASFRREYGPEILGVLMAGAREGQRRPGPMECLDLVSGGVCVRLRPRVPRSARSAFAAIQLAYLGAAVELAAAITLVATVRDVRSAVFSRNPGYTEGQWHAAVAGHIVPNAVAAGLAVVFWLWMARLIGRGSRWALPVFAAFFALNIYGLVTGLLRDSAVYARPDLAAGIVVCLVEFAAVVCIFRVRFDAPSAAGHDAPGR